MIKQNERRSYEITDKVKEFSKSTHWLAQYDEEDDFLSRKDPESLTELTQEE